MLRDQYFSMKTMQEHHIKAGPQPLQPMLLGACFLKQIMHAAECPAIWRSEGNRRRPSRMC
jgi:hypothetical protein